jgi:putative FmdB family regulatory protein
MPIYAYRCTSCGYAKDVLQKISDPLLTVCPECQAASFQKQLTAAGFQLKGSGWYVTDFRDGNKAGKAEGGKDGDKPASAPAAGGSDGAATVAVPAGAPTTSPATATPASAPVAAKSVAAPAASTGTGS